MFELEVGYDLALLVYDYDHVMITSPVKASIVRDLFPFFHFGSPAMHRGAVLSQPDTKSLVGCSSLRLRDRRRQTDR